MKNPTKNKSGLHMLFSPFRPAVKGLIISALLLTGIHATSQAQDTTYTKPFWRFGVAAGANFNFYRGSTQQLTSTFISPVAFHDGSGIGLYAAPLIEYYNPDSSKWGLMLQVGYDNRQGKFDQKTTPCNCPADLSTDLTYVSVEPSIRFAPFNGNFYLYGGPRFAYILNKSFTYSQKTNPDYPAQVAGPDVTGDFSSFDDFIISMQVGAGLDIPLSSQDKRTQWSLSPFVSFQPYFGQSPRSIETWNLTTIRAGASIKFGHGDLIPVKDVVVAPIIVPAVTFTVYSPANIPTERRVRETFPIRNYVFFDLGSTQIPDRYVQITKDQVKDFKEDQLEVFTPKRLAGRSGRQMVAYYNVLNILGDRMGKYPNTTVRLTGASMEGPDDGLAMAENVKKYLVNVFGIAAPRLKTEGRIKPRIPSEQSGGTKELVLLREGDRRVSIWSESPEILMQFQSGPDAPLMPVDLNVVQEAPLDSYVTFNVEGATTAFTSWTLEIRDEKGLLQTFGPYEQDKVSLPGKAILGSRPSGDYKITMIGKTHYNTTVTKEASVHMTLWTVPEREEGRRYSIIYEINNSDAIAIYDKYLSEIVVPKIPVDGTVIIHGHSDIIGSEEINLALSVARANDVKKIMEAALAKAGRKDVKFETYGFGEDEIVAPFENNFPEERFYNRTVIIDIIKK